MLYLAGNPDSPVLGYSEMPFHDGKISIVQLAGIIEVVRIEGSTGDTGQIGSNPGCIRKMVADNIVDIVAGPSGQLVPRQLSKSL